MGRVNILYICCPAFLKNIERSWEKQDAIFKNGFFFKRTSPKSSGEYRDSGISHQVFSMWRDYASLSVGPAIFLIFFWLVGNDYVNTIFIFKITQY